MVLFWKRKKSIYCWTRSRPTRTFGESNDQVRDKSESKYQRVQDKSETIEKRLETGLEYYSPSLVPILVSVTQMARITGGLAGSDPPKEGLIHLDGRQN